MLERPVEATEDVEHEDSVTDGVAEVVKGIRETLHPPTVLPHRQVALLKGAEGGVEAKGPGLGIAQELPLESNPGLTGGATVSADDILEI